MENYDYLRGCLPTKQIIIFHSQLSIPNLEVQLILCNKTPPAHVLHYTSMPRKRGCAANNCDEEH